MPESTETNPQPTMSDDDADVQRIQDWWEGRVCGLQAAEKRVGLIIRRYRKGMKGLDQDGSIYTAAFGATEVLKMLRRDLKAMQQPPEG